MSQGLDILDWVIRDLAREVAFKQRCEESMLEAERAANAKSQGLAMTAEVGSHREPRGLEIKGDEARSQRAL